MPKATSPSLCDEWKMCRTCITRCVRVSLIVHVPDKRSGARFYSVSSHPKLTCMSDGRGASQILKHAHLSQLVLYDRRWTYIYVSTSDDKMKAHVQRNANICYRHNFVTK